MDIKDESLYVKLKETDVRKIFRIIKKLRTDLTVEFRDVDMEMVTFDVYIDDYAQIKIIYNQLYVTKDDVFEFVIDDYNLVRDVILEIALKKNYDDMKKVMQLLYPNKSKRRNLRPKKRIIRSLEELKHERDYTF